MKMGGKFALVLWLTLIATGLVAQNLTSPAFAPGTRVSHAVQLSSILREPLPARMVAQSAASSYNSDNLYQYIDGGADVYLLYDFKALLHQDFKSGGTEVTADVYEMGNPEDAFGIYSSERSASYTFLPIGAEGYRSDGILNFLAGQYYVKLSGSGPNADTLLGQFARLLSSRIGGSRALPALLAKFPREHRVAHSEQYIKKDPLGHAFLAPAYLISYAGGKQQSKLLVSVASSALAAKARAEQLARHFKQTGEAIPAPDLGDNGLRAKNSFEGNVLARTRGRYLIALFNPAQNGAEVLKTAAQGLP